MDFLRKYRTGQELGGCYLLGGLGTSPSLPSMPQSVARNTKRNQVLHCIATQLTPRFQTMYLQILCGTALLAPPTISFQDQLSEDWVLFRVRFDPVLLLPQTHQVRPIYRSVPSIRAAVSRAFSTTPAAPAAGEGTIDGSALRPGHLTSHLRTHSGTSLDTSRRPGWAQTQSG